MPSSTPYTPPTRQQQLMNARTRQQLASLQYILSRLTMADAPLHTRAMEVESIEAWIRAFYPFPQDLTHIAILKVLQDADIVKRIEPIFKRAQSLHDQMELMRRIRMGVELERANAAQPDKTQPTTLGWRGWIWDTKIKQLRSLAQTDFIWEGPELRVINWDTSNVVRGVQGIHACLVPMNWEIADPKCTDMPIATNGISDIVTGIVERFGRYALGTEGWRAEWVIIRKLLAPTEQIGFALEMAYPEVPVTYYDHQKYGRYT